MQTQAVEAYLKAIYELQAGQKQVSTTALSERLAVAPASVTGMVKKLAALKLGEHQPSQGVPPPARDGSLPGGEFRRLVDVPPGETAVVAEVSDHDPALLRYLGDMGLYPRAEGRVVSAAPFEGPLPVRAGKGEHPWGREAAAPH